MIKIITTLALLFCTSLFSQSQYEKGMAEAIKLWGENKNTEASAVFERIASAEKENWLPNYYVALVNATAAFQTKDKQIINSLLTKAQTALDIETAKDANNVELMVVQCMIHTAWIVYDPMTNGMKLSPVVNGIYTKASFLSPNNPRVMFGKAEFEIGGAKYFGTDTKPLCAQIEKSIELFANFKPESPFHPTWGLERAQQALKECK
ncbi:hypothetical protein [Flavobacterium sp.]|uniref:hypothetical protein n=1 Tax=Flavobacterium sp. TaxID=239 RepID=UPI0037533F7D